MSLGAVPGTAGAPAPVTVRVQAEQNAVAGGLVHATVRTRASRDVVLQGGQVSLTCATSYRYTTGGAFGTTYSSLARESAAIASRALPGPTLLRGGKESADRAVLGIPAAGPPSVACQLVTIAWRVEAFVRFEGTGRAEAEPAAVAVAGAGQGADLSGATVIPRGRFGSIAVEDLATRRIVPGTELTGWVVLRPRRPTAVEGVRLALVLTQVVPHGPMLGDDPSRNPYIAGKEAEEVVTRVDLGAPIDVGGGELRAPFVLPVPATLPSPTLVTDQFALRWVLRVRVARRAAGLPLTTTADLELDVSTSPNARRGPAPT